MTKKALTDTMGKLRDLQMSHGDDSYNELWHAIDVLVNLGLLDKSYKEAMVKQEKRWFK